MTNEFDDRRAELLKSIATSVRDLAELYAAYPDRSFPSVDEPVGTVVVRTAGAVESVDLHNVYPMSCQHAAMVGNDPATTWGPVLYCILGLSRDGLPIH